MTKPEFPSFRMVVGPRPGTLTAGDEFTAERIDSYRIGSEVEVTIAQEKSSVLEKKYFAILSLVLKQCPLPERNGKPIWNTVVQMHDGIKWSFGIRNKITLPSGKEHETVGSTARMEGPEFELYFEGAMALLKRLTGVDPETLKKESAKVAGEESAGQLPPQGASPVEEGGGGGAKQTAAAADPPPPDNPVLVSEAAPSSNERDMVANEPMSTNQLKQEAIAKLLRLAEELIANNNELPTTQQKLAELETHRETWTNTLRGHPRFVGQVFDTAAKVIRGELPKPVAARFLYSLGDG